MFPACVDCYLGPVRLTFRLTGMKTIRLKLKNVPRYRNLTIRALRARLVYGSPNMNRAVSFEYMNRQLVWNEFSELLLLLLPLLNSSSIKNFLRPFSKDKSSDSSGDDTLCPICQGKPTIPFLAIPCEFYVSPSLYTATVTTVFKHGALLLRLFVAPDVAIRLLLCSDMVVRSTTLVRYNNSCERQNEMTGKASFRQIMDQKLPKDNIEIELGIKIP
ncbi:peroxisome assembly protein (Peroxin-2) [Datura stramonium]|uniref:RING-type E3 ubiquitin transferase (cysteine targeting) n=1 Tax=Datura stramonium TaxID=4076 RepID=A0ABS8THW1_DATST|nr:peroxisome assembly protein (Peroxin-2) [Datura stramonium]